jgi:hypothetical protein
MERIWDRQERFIWWYARLGKVKAAAKLAQVSYGTVDGWRRGDRYGIRGRMDDARAEFLRGRALIGRR